MALAKSGKLKIIKSRKWSLVHLGLLTPLPQRLGDKGPVCRCWLEQTVNSPGRLEFSLESR